MADSFTTLQPRRNRSAPKRHTAARESISFDATDVCGTPAHSEIVPARRKMSDLITATDLRIPDKRLSPWARIVNGIAAVENLVRDYGSLSPGDADVVKDYARICRAVADGLDRYAVGMVDPAMAAKDAK